MANEADVLLRRLGALDSCVVADALDVLGLPGASFGVRPMWQSPRIVGRAVTMAVEPVGPEPVKRHLGVAAIDRSKPGDVIVVEAGGRADQSSWGGLLSLAAAMRHVSGVVIDGGCRDVDEARDLQFPLFARGAVPMTARGRIQEKSVGEDIIFAGITVSNGDYVIADSSGIVFVEATRVERILLEAESLASRERAMGEALRAGQDVMDVLGRPEWERMLQPEGR